MWSQADLNGALDWVATLSRTDQKGALNSIGQQLVNTDVTRAIELLDRFPAAATEQLRIQIAGSLVQSQSIGAAESFIAKFRGTDDFVPLQASVIARAAAVDPTYAMQMARSVEDVKTRDNLYVSIVSQHANYDPREAMRWAESISSSQLRMRASSRVVSRWYQQDAAAAAAWLQGLPRGTERDTAVVAAVSSQFRSLAETDALIDSIGDPTQRKNANLAQVRRLMQTDVSAARRRLAGMNLSEQEREQYEQWFDQPRYAY
jgi:hypothetical protein